MPSVSPIRGKPSSFHPTDLFEDEDFAGIPATGNTVNFAGMHLVRVLDGVVVEWWLLDDNLGLMQQLGMELRPVADEEKG